MTNIRFQIFAPFSILFLVASGCGQSGSTAATQTEEMGVANNTPTLEAWEDMNEEFHKLMAFTYHPAEEGDLAPIKRDHAAMAAKAEEWAAMGLPEALKESALDKVMQQLKTDSKALSDLIKKGGSDEEIKTALFALHDVYHQIEELGM